MSKASSLDCFHLPDRQLKRKYATSQQLCRNYKSIQECSVHGDIHLFASVQPTAKCHSQQDESSSSQWWSQGSDARTLIRSWHLHVSPLCHQDSKKGFSPFQHITSPTIMSHNGPNPSLTDQSQKILTSCASQALIIKPSKQVPTLDP